MRIAIISDIHSNLEALQKSLEIIKEKNVGEIVCLGDIVGYGANPNECVTLVRGTTPHILMGNHDEAAVKLESLEYFNPYARAAAEWTHRALTDEHASFLTSLPTSLELWGLLFTHSSPYEPDEWHYILTQDDARMNFGYFTQPVAFFGHSHIPGIYSENGRAGTVSKNGRYLINVGSVGQPRDGNWHLSFGIFDTDTWSYENIRSEYDVNAAAAKIRKAGLPKTLADRIAVGR
jgi:predicted phosphodiesterase